MMPAPTTLIKGTLLAHSTGVDTQTQLWRAASGQTVVVVKGLDDDEARQFKAQPVSLDEAKRLFAIASWERVVAAELAWSAE